MVKCSRQPYIFPRRVLARENLQNNKTKSEHSRYIKKNSVRRDFDI